MQHDSTPIAQRLRAAADALVDERVALHELAAAHGHAAQGTLLVLLAVPCLLPIPGTGTVLGWGLLALALTLWRGQAGPGLPARVAAFQMPRRSAQQVLSLMARFYGMAGRLARERLAGLTLPRQQRWLAPKVALMALLIILPIPFGNLLPATALVLLGLGLVFRDGLAVLLAGATAALALLFSVALTAGAWQLGAAWWG